MMVRRWRVPALLGLLLAILAALGWSLTEDGSQRIAGISGSLQGIAPGRQAAETPSSPAPSSDATTPGTEPRPPAASDRAASGSSDDADRQAANREAGREAHGEAGRGPTMEGPGAQAARPAPIEALPETKSGEAKSSETKSSEPKTGASASGSNATRDSQRAAKDEPGTSLDVVRVEPNGDSVIAGRSVPNATIEVLRDNKPIASGKADGGGNFAILPPALPTGSSELSYRAVAPDGRTTQGNESVAVVIAENRKTKPLVAISTPDKPTQVLSRREAPATADASSAAKPETQSQANSERKPAGSEAKPPQRLSALPAAPAESASRQPVQIVSIDAREGGRLDVSAMGAPGSTLRLYLNDTMVANGQAGADGKLTFTIGRGVRPGAYQVRIDQLEGGGGKVAQRAQVAFAFPEALAPQARTAQSQPQSPAQAQADLAKPGAAKSDLTKADEIKPNPEQPAAPGQQAAAPPPAGSPTPSGQPTQTPSQPQAGSNSAGAEPSAKSGATAERTPSESGSTPQTPSAAPATPPVEPTAVPPAKAKRLARVLPPARPGAETLLARGKQKGPALAAGKDRAPAATAPEADARAQAENAGTPSDSTGSAPGTVFVDEVSTARISRGDNLWQISRRSYGSGVRYTVIYDANRDQIRNPDLIYPGQIFVLPRDEGAAKRG